MRDLLRHLREQLPEAVDLLEQMVSIESPSFDKPLVDRFTRFAGSHFQKIGGQVDYVAAEKFGDHLRVRFSGQSDKHILLLGHTDTVWGAGEIEHRPFSINEGRARGPGVFDMKAGIVLMYMAARALQ